MDSDPDLVIVGAGPAGLAAAREAANQGIADILVIDRDDAPGGLPRFCDHPGFGLEYAYRPYRGPSFAKRLMRDLASTSVRVECATTMISLSEGPVLEIVGPRSGHRRLRPRAIVLATGIREANRGNRMIAGARPEQGVLTTGQLQQLVARNVPLASHVKRLAVIGTEHVAFSALWTARHGGYRVTSLIGAESTIRSFAPARWLATAFGAEIVLEARLSEIVADGDRVTAIRCERQGSTITRACDGVVFTAEWIPETAALRGSGLDFDSRSGGPVIDQAMRTSLAGVFAAGNMLRPVESSGWAANEGCQAGHMAARFITGRLSPIQGGSRLIAGAGLAYVVPQRWDAALARDEDMPGLKPSLRVMRDMASARLQLEQCGGASLWTGPARPRRAHRRIGLDLDRMIPDTGTDICITLTCSEASG